MMVITRFKYVKIDFFFFFGGVQVRFRSGWAWDLESSW